MLVMANCKPIFDAATRDRWRILRIDSNMRFEDITAETLAEHDAFMEERRRRWDLVEAMKVVRLERKWDNFVQRHPEAEQIVQDRQNKRARHEEEIAEMRAARERHFALYETPIAKALRGTTEASSTASTAAASTATPSEFSDE